MSKEEPAVLKVYAFVVGGMYRKLQSTPFSSPLTHEAQLYEFRFRDAVFRLTTMGAAAFPRVSVGRQWSNGGLAQMPPLT